MGERLQPKDIGLHEDIITKQYRQNKMLRGTKLTGLQRLGKAILKKLQIKKKKKSTKPGQVDYDARTAEENRKKKQKDTIYKIFK